MDAYGKKKDRRKRLTVNGRTQIRFYETFLRSSSLVPRLPSKCLSHWPMSAKAKN